MTVDTEAIARALAFLRRLYLHMEHGGTIRSHDIAIVIRDLERATTERLAESGAERLKEGKQP